MKLHHTFYFLATLFLLLTSFVSGQSEDNDKPRLILNSRAGVNDFVIPNWKIDPLIDEALLHALLVTYKRGTVTYYDLVSVDTVEVPGNGQKYQMYSEIILGTNPCFVDYYEVWESVDPAGLDLTEQHKTAIPCRSKAYATAIINAGYHNKQDETDITVYRLIPGLLGSR